MPLRPAIHSTDDPPVPVENPLLLAYIWSLRRRIEVQIDTMAAYTADTQKTISQLQNHIESLSLDLGLRNKDHGPHCQEIT